MVKGSSEKKNFARKEESLDHLGFSPVHSFFEKSIAIRFLIGLFFGLILFVFLHFREVYVETFELGSSAPKYVVAQVDFVFPDEEATIILKQEASREIGSIYRLDEDRVYKEITEFQKYITQDALGSTQWNALAKDTDFKTLAASLSLISNTMLHSRFADVRTIERVEKLLDRGASFSADSFFVFIPSSDKKEERLPFSFWNNLKKQLLRGGALSSPVTDFIVAYYSNTLWKFKIDEELAYTFRKMAAKEIPEKFTYVKSGERLLDQGEKVTARHLAMLKAMKERLTENRRLFDLSTISGSLLFTLLFITIGALYLKKNESPIFTSNRKLALLLSILVLNIFFAKLTELFLLSSPNNLLDLVRFPLFIPLSAILISSLLNVRIAFFATIFLSLIFVLALAVESVSFLMINILTASIAMLSIQKIKKRKEVFIVGAKGWLGSFIILLAFNLYENTTFSFSLVSDIMSTFIFISATCVLVLGLLPILETGFHIITDITLMELMDPTSPLLRRLSIEAPGTYQHSMIVGSLAEAAASAIGANSLFCRVVTQYHDIGKLSNPSYFTENQFNGIDMHQLLTPMESSKTIIAHVSDGVALGRQMGLPEPFIDVIKEHHGTTLVVYFYHKQLELLGGDRSRIEMANFRYSGPKPRSKESTIIMIADALEAASRSLDTFNEESVISLADAIITQKTEDGQFDNSPLTFQEMNIIKKTMVKAILAATHSRIKYPPHHPGEEG